MSPQDGAVPGRAREDVMREHFLLAMSAAVPLEIARIGQMDEGERELLRERLGPMLQQGADSMLFGGRDGPKAFGAYARALALLAWNPGGVSFAGMGFCARHPRWPAGVPYPCPSCLEDERRAAA